MPRFERARDPEVPRSEQEQDELPDRAAKDTRGDAIPDRRPHKMERDSSGLWKKRDEHKDEHKEPSRDRKRPRDDSDRPDEDTTAAADQEAEAPTAADTVTEPAESARRENVPDAFDYQGGRPKSKKSKRDVDVSAVCEVESSGASKAQIESDNQQRRGPQMTEEEKMMHAMGLPVGFGR
ncbi:unnamed protein product [Vitrella brassicaformis CCMP3155]|uniref:Uncharacterized protein n=2 Tax=Vitrella brassicaformis TaxID=1169539 RepID=A0A0G4EF14_VITBC|nr:unnamed protein product [Vitrella brassicaformis CCMP3155]|mmetsp:Transcript_32719/g.94567  ORF Transcript_32719/g.94567 Transcript_32719/m.94567 type:complete len:180 (+) Transcript_32719:38-577(+)|eukprot:CEL93986.1 unnamed protein product [Vitrella brassicaformis CCMP3155]